MFARSLTGYSEAAELWKQFTSSVHSSPQPYCFLTSLFWSLGSRREEALHFSVAGFVPSIFCAFPTLYLTAFLTKIKDMVEALIHYPLFSTNLSPPLYPSLLLCVFLLQAFFQDSEEGLLFKFWPLWCTLWLVRGHHDGCTSAWGSLQEWSLPFTGMLCDHWGHFASLVKLSSFLS